MANDTELIENQTEKTVVAKLVAARNFALGDFEVINIGITGGRKIIVSRIKIATANSGDRGNIPKPGTLFNITGYPVDGGGDQEFVNRLPTRAKMLAYPIANKADAVTSIKYPPPRPLGLVLRGLADGLLGGAEGGPTCKKAPVTMKDAIKRLKTIDSTKQKAIPRTGKSTQNKDGEYEYDGPYTEYGDTGDVTITAGAKGYIIDGEGNIYQNGQISKDDAYDTEPHLVSGMPTKPNPVDHVIPKQQVVPILKKLPNFSLLNWTIKLFKGFDTAQKLLDIKSESGQWWKPNPEFEKEFKEDQEKKGLKGKIK